jgi:hypothetical protein
MATYIDPSILNSIIIGTTVDTQLNSIAGPISYTVPANSYFQGIITGGGDVDLNGLAANGLKDKLIMLGAGATLEVTAGSFKISGATFVNIV